MAISQHLDYDAFGRNDGQYQHLEDIGQETSAQATLESHTLDRIKEDSECDAASLRANFASSPQRGTFINIDIDMITPPISPLATTASMSLSDDFYSFAHALDFTLTINTINYPRWAKNEMRPLSYLPVPLAPLPGIPAIPEKIEISFTQIMDVDCFKDTIDGILHSYGYTFTHQSIEKVWVSYTHRNGKRERLSMSVDNVSLITKPWAKDVWLNHLDCVAGNCTCEECGSGQRKDGQYGHGLVVDIAFPQGLEVSRKIKDCLFGKNTAEYWAGKKKLPFCEAGKVVPRAVNYATSVRTVRFA